jgi:hypothetical protein
MIATKINDKCYEIAGVGLVQREYTGVTPAGVIIKDGRWVFRNHLHDYIDSDFYINDLAERQRFRFARDL